MLPVGLFAAAFGGPVDEARRVIDPPDGVALRLDDRVFAGGHRVVAVPEIDGRPVDGAVSVVGFGTDGAVRWAKVRPLPDARWIGALDASAAIVSAERARPALGAGAPFRSTAEQVFRAEGGDVVPAWAVTLHTAAPRATWRVWVDASDGRILAVDRTSRDADGRIWPSNPERGPLVRVPLLGLDDSGALSGPYVWAASCAEWTIADSLFGATSCDQLGIQAAPDADGDFLFDADPAGDPDPLAEVQVWYHVDRMSRWLDDRWGFRLPYGPIRATVNFPMANAFFGDFDGDGTPDVSFGHDPESGVDFGYDADVVYHELGHGVVGALAPRIPFLKADNLGMEWAPGSVNEGAADWWAMLLTLDPRVGEYAGSGFDRDAIRDLARVRRCPDDLRGEVHRDGEILGSFGWQLIADPAVGVDAAAELLYGSVPLWDEQTSWDTVGQSLHVTADDLLAAGAIGPATHEAILEHLADSGMEGCKRVIPVDDGLAPDLYLVTGGLQGDLERLPGGTQLSLEVPADAGAVVVTVSDVQGDPGMGFAIYGRWGRAVGHDYTEIAALGLGFSTPAEWDFVVDGAAPGLEIRIEPGGDPSLIPGERLYLSVASRNLGTLVPFDFQFGKITVAAEVEPVPAPEIVAEEPGPLGCQTGPGPAGTAILVGLSLAARRRRPG